ncbi:dihydroneopterin aldolase [Halobacillus shinanisalinarum]|uniref:7,8-dihydroneopterin aldolase n=1 Tax=Halobacillus shinanisalinarum TaxID=2932258 RepID=A0ABY4GTA8_9BACI|nr:dihydroneopterin aldolase [Halobacillus shinanisalinarum]UOQ91377.1 dihydroneopterin aldolase [Halobacillus shinanisalinarum]
MDKIYLNSMEFWGYHGLFPEENKLGQRFYVDLELELDLKPAAQTDDMNQSINYGEIYEVTKKVVEGEARKLVETVAEQLSGKLLEHFELLDACRVKVTKPDPPIPGHYKSVAIDIYRERTDD